MQFKTWIDSKVLAPFGLTIDESCICSTNHYIAFLDTEFCFNGLGDLQTDLNTKLTDSLANLYFYRAHPKHTLSWIVYFRQVRKIIKDGKMT